MVITYKLDKGGGIFGIQESLGNNFIGKKYMVHYRKSCFGNNSFSRDH